MPTFLVSVSGKVQDIVSQSFEIEAKDIFHAEDEATERLYQLYGTAEEWVDEILPLELEEEEV